MILLEIDTQSISGIEFEGDTPRAIDVDRVAPGSPEQNFCVNSLSGLEGIENVNIQIGDFGDIACH